MENEMKKLAEKLIELRKMATKVYHSKMKHMADYLCGEDGDGDFVMAEFNRGMPNWKRDLEFCIFASNHAADIAERMLRLEAMVISKEDLKWLLDRAMISPTHENIQKIMKFREMINDK